MYFIYEEIDPRTDIPGYVGYSSKPNIRHEQHLSDIYGDSLKSQWIAELSRFNMKPTMRIIEITETIEEALAREKYWIKAYESQGIELKNGTHTQNHSRLKYSTFSPSMIEKEWRSCLTRMQRDFPKLAEDIGVILELFIATYTYGRAVTEREEKQLEEWARKKWLEVEDGAE